MGGCGRGASRKLEDAVRERLENGRMRYESGWRMGGCGRRAGGEWEDAVGERVGSGRMR